MIINYSKNLITGILFSSVLLSCQSKEPKTDEAFNREKQERMLHKDSSFNSETNHVDTAKSTKVFYKEIVNDWDSFNSEMEKKIETNEFRIKKLKGIPNTDFRSLRKIARLEKDNNALKEKLIKYHEEMTASWNVFKAEMTNSAEGLKESLKEIKAE